MERDDEVKFIALLAAILLSGRVYKDGGLSMLGEEKCIAISEARDLLEMVNHRVRQTRI